jgi:hypothetical protein
MPRHNLKILGDKHFADAVEDEASEEKKENTSSKQQHQLGQRQ